MRKESIDLSSFGIKINDSKKTITVTKDFKKKAIIYGSAERIALENLKRDYPIYRVITNSAHKKKFEDRLDMKDILLYVEKHSGKDSEQMKELLELRGTSVKEAGNRVDADEYAGFETIKAWFFTTYPELANKTENRQKQIDAILKKAAKRAEAAKNAASA